MGSVFSSVKLPRLELPKFNGKVTEWQSFWDRFAAIVDEAEIPAISKFSYLQSLLEREAKSVIQGLSLTSKNYSAACTLLKERFGRPERIIFAHIQAFFDISMPPKSQGTKYVSALWKLQDELMTHVRSLEALGVKGEQYGLFLTPVILSRLPQDIRLEWSREGSGHESDLAWLLSFLGKEIERRERSDAFKEVSHQSLRSESRSVGEAEKRKVYPSSASALQTASEWSVKECGFCDRPHYSEKCFKILKLSLAEREEKIRSAELCFKCLRKGHIAKGCKARCAKCKGNHNVLCCAKSSGEKIADHCESKGVDGKESAISADLVGVTHSALKCKGSKQQTCSVLPTARVKVCGEKGRCTVAALLFDSGSDKSYVSSSLVKKMKPKWRSSEYISYSSFGECKKSNPTLSNIYDLQLMDGKGSMHSLLVKEIPVICSPLIRPSVPVESLHAFNSLEFADEYGQNRELSIDILIGLDAYWRFMSPNNSLSVEGLVAQESLFGWVLSGAFFGKENRVVSGMLCINSFSEASLHNFWDLESVGICSKENVVVANNPVLKSFSDSIRYHDGRYEVALPWRSESARSNLQNNEKLARKRLPGLLHKFDGNPKLQKEYDGVFEAYEQDGIIEEIPANEMISSYPTFYLPHRPVIREDSSTTKVSPVFDASARSYNGISLNDCFESGPSLNPLLVEVLMRFRRWKVALTGDITKAFLQISVRKEDRDVHRFLWNYNDNVRIMRFVSPFW